MKRELKDKMLAAAQLDLPDWLKCAYIRRAPNTVPD